MMKETSGGGRWHGVEYHAQVMNGEYEHLAIVPNPRYTESIILTPEQFREYNEQKKSELVRLANSQKESKGEKKMKFSFWEKKTVQNAEGQNVDYSKIMVTLPESKVDLSIEECIQNADKLMNMHGYASGDHMVKVGDSEMSVNDLSKAYCDMVAKNSKDEEEKKKAAEAKNGEGEEMENADEEEVENESEEEVENEAEEKPEVKKNSVGNIQKLRNADKNAVVKNEMTVSLSTDKVDRGKSLYGSSK